MYATRLSTETITIEKQNDRPFCKPILILIERCTRNRLEPLFSDPNVKFVFFIRKCITGLNPTLGLSFTRKEEVMSSTREILTE